MTIKEILERLSPDKKSQLMYAFEHQISQHVEYAEGQFVGVNVDKIKHLTVVDRAGVWATGRINNSMEEGL